MRNAPRCANTSIKAIYLLPSPPVTTFLPSSLPSPIPQTHLGKGGGVGDLASEVHSWRAPHAM